MKQYIKTQPATNYIKREIISKLKNNLELNSSKPLKKMNYTKQLDANDYLTTLSSNHFH